MSPEVADAAAGIRKAIDAISWPDVDAIVILSPHAREPGIYRAVRGSLAEFGIPGIEGAAAADPDLTAALGGPAIDAPVDHGVLVPLLLGRWDVPIVAVGVDSSTRLSLDVDRRLGVVASVNGSTGLSARAPSTALEGAVDAEARFVEALGRDVTEASRIALPGSCGSEVVTVFARTFEGLSATVLAHEAPVGVGYLVAEIA